MSRSYRTIVRKTSHSSSNSNSTVTMDSKQLKRKSSTGSTNGSSLLSISKSNSDNLILDSTKINYEIHKIPSDLLRFIPDSQLELIKPFIDYQDKESISFIQRKKYSTNVDERGYLTVFEYQINDNWIIWDYSTGYVFFTGLWKSCGNNKTDIIKLIENFPNIISTESVRRVRGGFLKIQGTWLPFEIVKRLAKNFCFNIRYCLIPLFGEDFPNQCLKPSDKNYGKLVDVDAPETSSSLKPRRRSSGGSNQNVLKPKFMKVRRSQSDSLQEFKPRLILKSSTTVSNPKVIQRSRINSLPILEMEEILKASKQLHDLSFNPTINNFNNSVPRRSSFNYGGFIWTWQNDNSLTILGKDEEAALIDSNNQQRPVKIPLYQQSVDVGSPDSSNPKLYQNYVNPYNPYVHYQPATQYYNNSIPRLRPFETPQATSSVSSTSSTSVMTTPQISMPSSSSSISSIPKKFDGFESLLNAANQLVNHDTTVERSLKRPTMDNSPKGKMNIEGLLS